MNCCLTFDEIKASKTKGRISQRLAPSEKRKALNPLSGKRAFPFCNFDKQALCNYSGIDIMSRSGTIFKAPY